MTKKKAVKAITWITLGVIAALAFVLLYSLFNSGLLQTSLQNSPPAKQEPSATGEEATDPLSSPPLSMKEKPAYKTDDNSKATEDSDGVLKEMLPEKVNKVRQKAYRAAKAGDLEKAVKLILEALRMEPGSRLLQRETSHLFAMRGFKNMKRNDYDRALGFFQESLYYWEENPEAVRGMGATYYRTNEKERAEKWLKKFIDMGGDRPGVYNLLGRIYYERNRLEEALYHFRVSLSLAPEQPQISELADKVRREINVEAGFTSEESRNFRLKYEGTVSPEVTSLVLRICEEAYLDIGSTFKFYPENPVTIILYTDKQFSEVTQSPAWAEAIFDGKIRLPVQGLTDRSRVLERLIYHEFTHALVHEAGGKRAPIWMHEGMAQSMEGVDREISAVAKKVVEAGGPFPLSTLEGGFLDMPSRKAKAAYLESWLAMRYMDMYYGPFVMSEMIDALQHGGEIEDAVQRVTSRDYKEFDQSFLEWVREEAGAL